MIVSYDTTLREFLSLAASTGSTAQLVGRDAQDRAVWAIAVCVDEDAVKLDKFLDSLAEGREVLQVEQNVAGQAEHEDEG